MNEKYQPLFDDDDPWKRVNIAKNPNATKFDKYKNLFNDKFTPVRINVAKNLEATKFEEYKQLFIDWHFEVRKGIVNNPNAVNFEEFSQLFTDEHEYVRCEVASNPNLVNFKEYKNLFNDISDNVKISVVNNSEAVKFPEYKNLFKDKSPWVRKKLAENLLATEFDEYKTLFNDISDSVRINIVNNTEAVKFPEYKILFKDKSPKVRLTLAESPSAMKFEEYKMLLDDEDVAVRNTAFEKLNPEYSGKQISHYKDLIIEEAEVLVELENIIKIPITSEGKRKTISSGIGYSNENGHITQLKITDDNEYYVKIENQYEPIFFEKRNSIKKLPESIGNLKFLESLIINGQHLDSLPVSLEKLKNLMELKIIRNNLKEVPDCIQNLLNLEKIDLSYNKIRSLPDFLWKLKKIKFLSISDNKIKKIPAEISQLRNLEWLNITDNSLDDLPASLSDLDSLETLYIHSPGYENDLINKKLIMQNEDFNWLKKMNIKAENGNFVILPEFIRKLMRRGCRIAIDPKRFQPDDPSFDHLDEDDLLPLTELSEVKHLIPNRIVDFSRYEMKKKGIFQISSGYIIVTDPGLWMGNEISALNGRWHGFFVEDNLALVAIHEDYLNKQTKYEDWLISMDPVGVDGARCGIFDSNPSNSEGIISRTYYGDGSFPYFVYKTHNKKAAIIWVEFTDSFF